MKIIASFFTMSLAALLLCGCGNTIHGKAIAEPQVAVFHSQLDAENYMEIYSNVTSEFRKATPESKFTGLLAAIHRKLGNVVTTTNAGWRLNTYNFATQVVLVQETKFEKGTGTETFTFSVSNGKAALMGYNINSTDMLMN